MIKSIKAACIPLLLLSVSTVFSQMPMGDFHYTIEPKQATIGGKVTFTAREFNMHLYSYEVTYEVLPSPISSRLTWILRMKAARNPQVLTAAGYSGPKVVFDSLRAGFYRLEFDSTSDFKQPLGDSNTFEILPAGMGLLGGNRDRDPARAAGNGAILRWREENRRLDGRLEKQPPKAR